MDEEEEMAEEEEEIVETEDDEELANILGGEYNIRAWMRLNG
jgi:hypothetical protein